MGFVIGSWNIREFTGERERQDIAKIADIIKKEQFDIIALQEVKKVAGITSLKGMLGSHWSFYCDWLDPNISRTANYGLGFLWNTIKMRECSESHPSRVELHKRHMEFERDPLCGKFTPIRLPLFEIRLINVHLCSSTYGINNNIKKRIEEFNSVSGHIYEQISIERYRRTKREEHFKQACTVILGDYNLTLKQCENHQMLGLYHADTYQKEGTHIPNEPLAYGNDLDHFGYNERMNPGVSFVYERVDTVNKYMGGDFEKHRGELSDHVPIKLKLTLV